MEAAMTRRKEAGQALVFAALGMTVFLGFAGLAVDMGILRYDKRLQQTAADAAAIAGADELRYGTSGVTSDAQNASGANGFTDNSGGAACTNIGCITVTVNNPPLSGPHTGQVKYVEVLVSDVQPTLFMKAFGVSSKTVVARAVATNVSGGGLAPGCIYTLGPAGTGVGVATSGTPFVQAPTCGISDNGNFTTNGKKVDVNAGTIGVVGTDKNNGGGTITCTVTPTTCPALGAPPVPDPLSFVPPPCTSCSGGSALNINGSQTVSPGTYSSISITGGTVDFQPGMYIINGNFTVNGNATVCNSTNANCTGMPGSANSGVTFYITNGGSVTINGTATDQLSAPNSGTYAGMLFYQDPNDSSLAKIDGTSQSYFQGSLYFPSAELDFGGNSLTNSLAQYTIIVVDDLKFNGNATVDINSNYSSLPGGVSIVDHAILVE
jgi:Putative Flp pilus-assembly TadE/G-like